MFCMETKKRLLSGVKPTGRPHLGNYLGAMRQFVDLAKSHESFVFIADYHALNSIHDANQMRQNTIDLILDYLAIGLDPKEVVLFKQSDLAEHTELCWIFNTFTTMPYLMRAHAYKDAQAKNKEINVGTFDYPMLMAADILLYEPDIVPVGADQKQHVEYARDTAEKFNSLFGATFKLPEPYIPKEIAIIPGVDGQKMSKSYNNTIPLFADSDVIRKATMSIVTDSLGVEESKDPEKCNIFALHKHFSKDMLADLEKRYREGGIGYKESKEILADNILKFVTPMRELRSELSKEKGLIEKVLEQGREKAHAVASAKMQDVKKKIGVLV
ncbi:MAG: Tryptophan-tRNA ligase [Parcubacteria group bacterium GW2011_GWA2_43_11]|nr:MAG: Tryptophan-tRNA ligase [Parcubacteria group bacterium GW2011_GWA2_43_11]